MADIGLNQNFQSGSREFHIQTVTHVDEGIVRSEVFEEGKLLFVAVQSYERRNGQESKGPELRLQRLVDQFHQAIIEGIDNLFEISKKIFEEDKAPSHVKIGSVFLYMHIFDKAEAHFQRSIELNPEHYDSRIHLARCYLLQKRLNQAHDTVSSLLAKKLDYPDLYNLVGLILLEKKQFINALQYFQQAIKKNPAYTEVYLNLAEALLRRINVIISNKNDEEFKKTVDFLKVILKKIEKVGKVEDRDLVNQLMLALNKSGIKKALSLLHEYRDRNYFRRIPPEVVGYEFYLRLRYAEEEMSLDVINSYEAQISSELKKNPEFPDLWNYVALIHLMQCRFFFLKGLENFREATRINPNFEKAKNNLRLVENDGREFLSLINAIV
jgi:tetratricopeptide (TPR) repeat protein